MKRSAPEGDDGAEGIDPTVNAIRLRHVILDALLWEDWARLRNAVRALSCSPMTAVALVESGVGALLRDDSLDRHLGPIAANRQAALVKWRALNAGEPARRARSPTAAALGRGWSAQTFAVRVKELAAELEKADPAFRAGDQAHRRVASRLVLLGFHSTRSLEGMQVGEVVEVFSKLDEIGVIRRTLPKLSTVATPTTEPASGSASPAPVLANDAAFKGVDTLLSGLSETALAECDAEVERGLAAAGVPAWGDASFPRTAITRFAASGGSLDDRRAVLDAGVEVLKMSSQKRNLPSVASGLRCWGAFARQVLDYSLDAELPPRSSKDVQRWLVLFRNHRTAKNYLGYLRWAGKAFGLPNDWDDEQLALASRGHRIHSFDRIGPAMPAKWRLTTLMVLQVVTLATSIGGLAHGFSECCVTCWWFLLRVMAEGIPLERGIAAELTELPAGRHSTVYIDAAGWLVIGLRRRKHRPKGSVLRRPCLCRSRGAAVCPVHVMKPLLDQTQPGSRLWAFSGAQFLRMLRRALQLLGVAQGQAYTLKAFRAGRATEMAKDGESWSAVLAAGEWKTMSALAYIDEDAVDTVAAVHEAVVNSSDEEE